MGYQSATLGGTWQRWSQTFMWKTTAVIKHAVASHQVWMAVAFLCLWGCRGFIAKFVELLLILDLLECWFTTEDKIDFPKDWKILIVGGGFSGLGQAKRLLDAGITNFTILEKSSRLGGTWNHNIYPGVACDVPSHLYCYSFFPNPWWSRWYSPGAEIWKYTDRMAEKFGLKKYIEYNQEATNARWDETTKTWTVETKSGQIYVANIVFNASGPFPKPNIPNFKNMDKFSGRILHSAEWDPALDLKDKRVAIVGTGASSVQITPSICDQVKELTVFQRSPAWVPTRHNLHHTKKFQYVLAIFPWFNKFVRYLIFWLAELIFHGSFKEDGFCKDYINRRYVQMMQSKLGGRKDLEDKLIPKYRFGCKRITPNDNYLKAFTKPHVKLVDDPIEEFKQNGIVTKSGKEYKCDIVILATGFNMLDCTFPYYGRNQEKHLLEIWGDEPRAYLGCASPELPNAFFITGPGSGLGHNSIIYVAECQMTYSIDAIRNLVNANKVDEEIRSLRLKDKVLTHYVEESEAAMKNVAFGGSSCPAAWYKNSRGVNWTLYPKDLVSFWWESRYSHWQDYVFQ